jgi:SAM-dependent methyltransferase
MAEQRDAFADWADAYRRFTASGQELVWPSETLVRLLKGAYVPGLDRTYQGKAVLDVGFGNANNLLFLNTLGLRLFGTEVDAGICDLARAKLGRVGATADLRVGTNRSIPFPDDAFDLLVSWNVLHYEDNEAHLIAAIREYARVLRPGGRFLLSTTGPEHKILEGAETLGGHRYRIRRPDDFRKGQVYFYFDTPAYVRHYLGMAFRDVLVGRTHDNLFTETLDWFIATGVKPQP